MFSRKHQRTDKIGKNYQGTTIHWRGKWSKMLLFPWGPLPVLKMFNLNVYSHTGRVDWKQSLKEGVGGTWCHFLVQKLQGITHTNHMQLASWKYHSPSWSWLSQWVLSITSVLVYMWSPCALTVISHSDFACVVHMPGRLCQLPLGTLLLTPSTKHLPSYDESMWLSHKLPSYLVRAHFRYFCNRCLDEINAEVAAVWIEPVALHNVSWPYWVGQRPK